MFKAEATVDYQKIKSRITDSALASHYLKVTKIPCLISSPLREDSKPSFGLFSPDNTRIYFKDFATGESGNLYTLIQKLYNLHSFTETLAKISTDFCLEQFDIAKDAKPIKVAHIKINHNKTNLKCKVRKWRKHDIAYWESYGISMSLLEKASVFPIDYIILEYPNWQKIIKADKYAYVFVERKEDVISLKTYQPYNKKGFKWMSSHDKSVLSLWTLMPETGDTLFICSSLKDALCLTNNTEYPAIAPQGEGFSISNTALAELKRRFKKIYVLFDNDEAGIKFGKKLSESKGFINLVLPQFEGGKDVSDFYKTYGKIKLKETIKNLLQNN